MGIKRIIDVDFWQDPTTLYDMSVEDRYFHLYLMTNPRTTQLGIYCLPVKYLSLETGYQEDVVKSLLKRAEDVFNSIVYDPDTQEIALLSSLSYSVLKGGAPVRNLLRTELSRVKSTRLLEATYSHMFEFWARSQRPFDQTIQDLFKAELELRTKPLDQLALTDLDEELQDTVELPTAKAKSEDSTPQLGEREQVTSYYEKMYGTLSKHDAELLDTWCQDFTTELIIEALARSKSAKKPVLYAKRILESWKEQNITSIDQVSTQDEDLLNRASGHNHAKPIDDPYANIKIPIDYWKHE